MNKVQLLVTFTPENRLDNTINTIKSCYNLTFNKIFILKNVDNPKDIILSYNINSDYTNTEVPHATISVHRHKEFNTLYTINALNYIIATLNDGKEDKNFIIPWCNYRNCLLITNTIGIRKINTELDKIYSF